MKVAFTLAQLCRSARTSICKARAQSLRPIKVAVLLSACLLAPHTSAAEEDGYLKFLRHLNMILIIYWEDVPPAYYFEKRGIFGDWISTALVFGYPNNSSACMTIMAAAQAENPSMEFRCRYFAEE